MFSELCGSNTFALRLSTLYLVPCAVCQMYMYLLVTYGLAAEKRDLRTYANSEDPDQSVHTHSLVRIFAVCLHNIGTLLKI